MEDKARAFTMLGELGEVHRGQAAFHDDDSALSATFTPGGRPFRATAAGLDGDAFFLGLGAEWLVRENLGLGLHWRADFRADAETENQFGISTSFRF